MKKIYSLSLSALVLGMMASCSNDMDNKGNDDNTVSLKVQQAPDFYAYSGHEVLLNTLGTKAETTEEGNKTDKYDQHEVEINLSINDLHMNEEGEAKYEIEDLISKLSIHLRAASDVTIVLPVPATMYCDQDDFAVFGTHEALMAFTGESSTKTVTVRPASAEGVEPAVEALTVNLTVTYTPGGEGVGNITITTEGMSQPVLDYCKATYADGLNIEIYNYFKGSAVNTIEALKAVLEGSKVTFGSVENVDYYINAFNQTKEGEKFGQDCTVAPTGNDFDDPTEGEHFNGSKYNQIYSKKVTVTEE